MPRPSRNLKEPSGPPVTLSENLRICVVGAGIGGTSAAYHLRKELEQTLEVDRLEDLLGADRRSVAIDILEASDRVGGRCRQTGFLRREGHPETEGASRDRGATKRSDAREDLVYYECGASILSEMNEIVIDFARLAQQDQKEAEKKAGIISAGGILESCKERLAELKLRWFDIKRPIKVKVEGDPFPFAIRRNFSHWAFQAYSTVRRCFFCGLVGPLPLTFRLRLADAITTPMLLWKYGFGNLRKLKNVVKRTTGEGAIGLNFDPLYEALEEGEGFHTVEALLHRTCGTGKTSLRGRIGAALAFRCPSPPSSSADAPADPSAVARLATLLTQSARCAIFGDFPADAEPLMQELVGANMRGNYGGQGLGALHGYVGMVSVAGGLGSKCFGVAGGNEMVIQGIMERAVYGNNDQDVIKNKGKNFRSCVKLQRNTAVTFIRVDQATKKYAVKTETSSKSNSENTDPSQINHTSNQETLYDIVIFAAPLQARPDPLLEQRSNKTAAVELFDPTTIPQFQQFLSQQRGGKLPPLRRCVATLVQGKLKQDYWKRLARASTKVERESERETSLKEQKEGLFDGERELPVCAVITQDSETSGDPVSGDEVNIYSCSLLLPTHLESKKDARAWQKHVLEQDPYAAVWKIFSPEVLDQEQIDRIFDFESGVEPSTPAVPIVQTFDWLAYPTYDIAGTDDFSAFFLPFRIQENRHPSSDLLQNSPTSSMLLYVNAIENSASALEMSAIGGKNVANLAVDFVRRREIIRETESGERKKQQ